jgi:putative Mg2+ transporter-C (MgtC) family protein
MAASLLATGAVGTAVGLGSYEVASMISVFTFLTLRITRIFKSEALDDPEHRDSC